MEGRGGGQWWRGEVEGRDQELEPEGAARTALVHDKMHLRKQQHRHEARKAVAERQQQQRADALKEQRAPLAAQGSRRVGR